MARSSDSMFLLSLLRDKTFQAREIRRVIMLSLLYLAVTTALVGVFYHFMLGRLLDGMAPLLFVSEDIALANDALPSMTTVLSQWMLIMLGVNTVITVCVAIFITRKLGQPILAIKRALREVGNGELHVRLRSSDRGEFGEIVAELATAMHSVRTQIALAKEGIAEADSLNNKPSQETQFAPEIDLGLDKCRSALEFFQLEPIDADSKGRDTDGKAA